MLKIRYKSSSLVHLINALLGKTLNARYAVHQILCITEMALSATGHYVSSISVLNVTAFQDWQSEKYHSRLGSIQFFQIILMSFQLCSVHLPKCISAGQITASKNQLTRISGSPFLTIESL